ncbi:MAG: hypothetical protein LBF22_07495 [Deltaproteobacteria bacterium]|jgi:hypothetical protein|nr:hypothetical protein [Deltaproteobacteria bacterium]
MEGKIRRLFKNLIPALLGALNLGVFKRVFWQQPALKHQMSIVWSSFYLRLKPSMMIISHKMDTNSCGRKVLGDTMPF